MTAFFPLIVEVALQLLSWILSRNKENKEMQELFYRFIEKQHEGYLNSAIMREKSQARLKAIFEKPWVETV